MTLYLSALQLLPVRRLIFTVFRRPPPEQYFIRNTIAFEHGYTV
jgi:hypothetical protein